MNRAARNRYRRRLSWAENFAAFIAPALFLALLAAGLIP